MDRDFSFSCKGCTHSNLGIRPEQIHNNECALLRCRQCNTTTVLCLYPGCPSYAHPSTHAGYNTKNYDPLRRFVTLHINRSNHKKNGKVHAATPPAPPDAKRMKTSASSSDDEMSFGHQANDQFEFFGENGDKDAVDGKPHAYVTCDEFDDDVVVDDASTTDSDVNENIADTQPGDDDANDALTNVEIHEFDEFFEQIQQEFESEGMDCDDLPSEDEKSENLMYQYRDFDIYDFRPDENQNGKKPSLKKSIYCGNQLYMYQRYEEKAKDKSNGAGGFQGLVSRVMTRLHNDKFGKVEKGAADVVFDFTQMIMKLPKEQQQRLMKYERKRSVFFGYNRVEIDRKCTIRMPTDYNEIRRMFTEGSYSILRNFPTGNVFRIGGHSCISLKEVFLLAAGHHGGFSFSYDGRTKRTNKDGLNGTKAVEAIKRDAIDAMRSSGKTQVEIDETNIGYFYFWSDSFLRCFIKQKNNSVWILTVTISPPADQISTGKFTHVLAMGKSTEDHTDVINHFHREARELMEGFKCYFGDHNTITDTVLVCLFHSADRPEANEVANTRKEGDFGKLRGYSVCLGKKFAACSKCYKTIAKNAVEGTSEQSNCSVCLCWEISEKHDPKMYPKAPPSYPKYGPDDFSLPQEDRDLFDSLCVPCARKPGLKHLGPMKQTSYRLSSLCTFAYHALRLRLWTKVQTEQYLRTCNINAKRIGIIVGRAQHDKENNIITDPEAYLPEIWSTDEKHDIFQRYKRPDLPLHAIAHGIIENVMLATQQIFSHWKKYTEYVENANLTILDVATFRLSWCKLKPLPKASWIGEHEMAYMRIMSYLLGRYFVTGNFSSEVSKHVLNMKRLINALQSFVSLVMSKRPPRADRVQAVAKLLMSTAHQLQKEYGSLKNKATINDDSTKKNSNSDILDDLSREDIISLLDHLSSYEVEGRDTQELKNNLNQICSIKVMKKKMEDLKLKMCGSKLNKVNYQIKLFGHLLNRDLSTYLTRNERSKNGQGQDREKKEEEFMWEKGAWISLCTNLAGQIEYLGILTLIW